MSLLLPVWRLYPENHRFATNLLTELNSVFSAPAAQSWVLLQRNYRAGRLLLWKVVIVDPVEPSVTAWLSLHISLGWSLSPHSSVSSQTSSLLPTPSFQRVTSPPTLPGGTRSQKGTPSSCREGGSHCWRWLFPPVQGKDRSPPIGLSLFSQALHPVVFALPRSLLL